MWREAICMGPYSKLQHRWPGPATDKPQTNTVSEPYCPAVNRDLARTRAPAALLRDPGPT